MKKTLFAALLVVILTACAPAPPTTDVQSTALAIVQTGVALTQTTLPTHTPTLTPTATIVLPTFSPVPTLVRPIFTPDAIQLERWQEYQTELVDAFNTPSDSICEWDILGRSAHEVYVWAMCAAPEGGDSGAAAIYLDTDGSIQKIKAPRYWMGDRGIVMSNENELFPADVIAKLDLYKGYYHFTGRPYEINLYLNYRLANPGTLPWVVLLGTPTGTPMP